jgi:hypothetical protein
MRIRITSFTILILACAILTINSSATADQADRKDGRRPNTAVTTVDAPRTGPGISDNLPPAKPTTTPSKIPLAGEQINWWVIASGGGTGISTSYGLSGTAGQIGVDEGNSTNYQLQSGFWSGIGGPSCCHGRVGDANDSGHEEPSIGDISAMIDAKFIGGSCEGVIDCILEADVNQSGGVNATCDDISIGDISIVIDYLFIAGPDAYGPLPDCL